MRTRLVLFALILAASCASGPPRPGETPGFTPPPPRTAAPTAKPDAILFSAFDQNTDLILNADEIDRGIDREFARADRNHDQVLTFVELESWADLALGGFYAPRPMEFDADRDSRVTAAEFTSELRSRALGYDKNGDGVIEHAELVTPGIATVDDGPRQDRRLHGGDRIPRNESGDNPRGPPPR